MTTPHERSVGHANRTNDELGRLFDQLGTIEAPNGWLLRAYRNARRALMGNLDSLRDTREVLGELRDLAESSAHDLYGDAVQLGVDQAGDDLNAYDVKPVESRPDQKGLAAGALVAFLATLDQQIGTVIGMVAAGAADEGTILGDDVRVGLFTPGPVLIEARRWVTLTATNAWSGTVSKSLTRKGDAGEYMRQAVATIDERTTDCCLKVHGQIVGLSEDFHLTGTPRFADYVRHAPFHWNCRSAEALVHMQDADDAVTRLMQGAARTEMDARGPNDQRETIYPSNAGSYRPSQRGTIRDIVQGERGG